MTIVPYACFPKSHTCFRFLPFVKFHIALTFWITFYCWMLTKCCSSVVAFNNRFKGHDTVTISQGSDRCHFAQVSIYVMLGKPWLLESSILTLFSANKCNFKAHCKLRFEILRHNIIYMWYCEKVDGSFYSAFLLVHNADRFTLSLQYLYKLV
jgi:hypothetical protein